MRITYRDGLFIAIATYEERDALRAAGFAWHPGEEECKAGPSSCLACRAKIRKAWWTKRPEAAARLSAHTDELARKALAAHLKAVEMSRATETDVEIPAPKGLTFYPYQKAGIAYMASRESTLLGDEQGLGKSPQAIGVVNLDQKIKSVLVVCPATLRTNWLREARRWLVKDERSWNFHIVDEDAELPASANFVIVHYQRISTGMKSCTGPCEGEKRRELPCPDCKGTGSPEGRPDICCATCGGRKAIYCPVCRGRGRIPGVNLKIVGSLLSRQWDLLVVDEAHFVKNPTSSRTKAVIGNPYKNAPGLVHHSSRKLFLTGTPLPNRPVELWPILSVCAPKEFGDFRAFARRYCDAHQEFIGKNKKVWKVDGASNLEELQERMRSSCMIRRLKKDVLKDLPPKIRQVIPLTPNEKAKRLITEELEVWERRFGADIEMVKETMNVAEESQDPATYQNAVERLQYIQRVAFMEMAKVRHQVAVAKIPMVIEHLENLFAEGVEKIICFAHHHDVIGAIRERFGKEAVALYGESKPDDRQKAIDEFQQNPKIKLFVGGILAAGVGITLTASSTVVFAELDWVPASVSQAEDRAHRIGQVNTVLVQHLVLDGSLDARMAQLLVEKQEIAERALDRRTDVAVKGVLQTRPEAPAEPVPLWKKIALKEALIILAQRRDPSVEGGHGFSQFDAPIGQKFATQKWPLSDAQAHLAEKLVFKYRRQLDPTLCTQLGIVEPPEKPKTRNPRKPGKDNEEPLLNKIVG